MNDKFVFQNARIKHMESKLLTVQAVQRLVDCTNVDEAFRTLIDMGFGSGATFEGNDFDRLFDMEEEKSVSFLKEFNVDGALDVFLMQFDYLNLKAVLKAQNVRDVRFSPSGLYPVEDIKSWVCDCNNDNNNDNMPAPVKEAVLKLQKLASEGQITPHLIDSIVDKAMYKHIFSTVKKSGKLAKSYFVRKTDYLNLSSFLRCKKLGLSFAFFEDGFIEGGEFDLIFYKNAFDNGGDYLKESCKHTAYEEIVAKVVDEGNIIAFEVAQDNALLKMWKDEHNDLFSIAPIVSYYLRRTTELKSAKLIVAGIKNRVAPQIIKERMREIYA